MKTILAIALSIAVFALVSFGQKVVKPTLTPEPPTLEQDLKIAEGIKLHDAKRYDEAVAKYSAVLAESPNCTRAMYELAMTLYAKGEKDKAMEVAYRGSKYISDELPLFYGTMANILDDYGKSKESVGIYMEGLKALSGDMRFGKYRSSLYFNLGVTDLNLKKYDEAKRAFKNAVENDYAYASPHYLLSVVFNGTKYRIPALLAAARFLSVEYNTKRSGNAATIIMDVLKPPQPDPKTGNLRIDLDFGSPIDEGDFGAVNLLLPMMMAAKDEKDKGKTRKELFIEAMDSLISMLGEDKKLSNTFVGKQYVPFMLDMKKHGHLEAFGNMVLYISGDGSVQPWLAANDAKLYEFMTWAKAYQPPVK